ncbi:MAG: hypothetical protein IJ743_02275 [Bacilli bacterium]|nr:hypothetical protein [Bacilli bacterium]
MKKINFFIIFTFILFSFSIIDVKANSCDDKTYQCIECSYDSGNFTYVVYSDGAGNAKIDEDNSKKYESNTFTINDKVKGADFINEDGTGLACPFVRRLRDDSKAADSQDDVPYVLTASQAKPESKFGQVVKIFEPVSTGPTSKPFVDEVSEDVKATKTCLFVDASHKNNDGESLKIRISNNGSDFSFEEVPRGFKVNIPRGESFAKLQEEFKKDCSEMEIYFLVIDDDDTGEKIVEVVLEEIADSKKVVSMNNISDPDTIEKKSQSGQKDTFTPAELCDNGECDISMDSFCDEAPVKQTFRFIGMSIVLLKILVPIILIGMGIVSLVQVILSGKEDEMKKRLVGIVKRVLIGIVIFLLPGIIDFLFDTVSGVIGGERDSNTCESCLLDLEHCD